MTSSAPCLHGTKSYQKNTQRCYRDAVDGSGYCEQHKPKPYTIQGGWVKTAPLPKGWGRVRENILRKHKGICYICGQPGADEVDHIIPRHLGGSDLPHNLAPIHQKLPPHCHRKKTQEEAQEAKKMLRSKRRRGHL